MEDPNLVIQEILTVLRQASVADTQTQKHVAEYVSKLMESPHCAYCLATVFNLDTEPREVDVRQQAGLLLKNHIVQQCANQVKSQAAGSPPPCENSQPGNLGVISAEIMTYIKECALRGLVDPHKNIRSTAGTIVTTVVNAEGVENWPHVVKFLVDSLGSDRSDVSDTSFETLMKVVEDELSGGVSLNNRSQVQFFRLCRETLLPRIFQLLQVAAQGGAEREMIQLNCLSLLNIFASQYLFGPDEILEDFFGQYFQALGSLAVETAPALRQKVVLGMINVTEFNELAIICNAEEVIAFMATCAADADYKVRLDSLEFWPLALKLPNAEELLANVLPRLLTCLVENTRYSEWDYLQMDTAQLEDDNANLRDRVEDLQPRFHDGGNGDADGDEDEPRAKVLWGTGWTVRKASALALDCLATKLGETILPHTLPLIEARLLDADWELREAAVLTLGAIAQGCQEAMSPFLPNVLTVLLNLCDDAKPLLRSISAWCLCKYARWVCRLENKDQALQPLLAKILTLTLDRNKSVQEAAASAFATIEEEAGQLLVPYLDDIITSFCTAFDLYQTNNLLVLYDAVGTLADCVGYYLNRPSLGKLLEKLFDRWQRSVASDYILIAVLECVSCLASALRDGFVPYSKITIERAVEILDRYVTRIEKPEEMTSTTSVASRPASRELVDSALDLFSALVESVDLESTNCFQIPQLNFIPYIHRCCAHPSRQTFSSTFVSGFALVGRLARKHIAELQPELPKLLPLIVQHLTHGSSSVCNNAAWALGEIAVKAPGFVQPYVERIMTQLSRVIESNTTLTSLRQNACFTISRVGCAFPAKGAAFLPQFLHTWCVIMAATPNDPEKLFALQGVCFMLQNNREAIVKACVPFMEAVASFYAPLALQRESTSPVEQAPPLQPLPPQVIEVLQSLLLWMSSTFPAEWKSSWDASRPSIPELIQREILSPNNIPPSSDLAAANATPDASVAAQ